jgi:molecular chaperone GrpE (heat shock protein)
VLSGAAAEAGAVLSGAAAEAGAVLSEAVAEAGASPAPGAAVSADALAEACVALRELVVLSERYHTRAEQREGVIDLLRSELDVLRRGERRGVLRPVLTDLCRLRDDLLNQADTLPADFDAARAAGLLRSYAETIELTLESNGVVGYSPDAGERFDPRLHRRAGGEPAADPALNGHIAGVRRAGYMDIEAKSPIAPAEVTVFAAAKATQAKATQASATQQARATEASVTEASVTEGEQ